MNVRKWRARARPTKRPVGVALFVCSGGGLKALQSWGSDEREENPPHNSLATDFIVTYVEACA